MLPVDFSESELVVISAVRDFCLDIPALRNTNIYIDSICHPGTLRIVLMEIPGHFKLKAAELPTCHGRIPFLHQGEVKTDTMKKRPCGPAGPCGSQAFVCLARDNVGRTRALLALSNLKLYLLTFIKGCVALSPDLGVVDEQIFAAIVRVNEAKTFTCIEPFYCTCAHLYSPWPVTRPPKLNLSISIQRVCSRETEEQTLFETLLYQKES